MANLTELNKRIAKEKAKRKKKPAPKPVPKANDIDKLVTALDKVQKPVVDVKVEPRKPMSYRATIERNSRGEMIAAKIEPIIEG
jgi:hypothetical protein